MGRAVRREPRLLARITHGPEGWAYVIASPHRAGLTLAEKSRCVPLGVKEGEKKSRQWDWSLRLASLVPINTYHLLNNSRASAFFCFVYCFFFLNQLPHIYLQVYCLIIYFKKLNIFENRFLKTSNLVGKLRILGEIHFYCYLIDLTTELFIRMHKSTYVMYLPRSLYLIRMGFSGAQILIAPNTFYCPFSFFDFFLLLNQLRRIYLQVYYLLIYSQEK